MEIVKINIGVAQKDGSEWNVIGNELVDVSRVILYSSKFNANVYLRLP